MPFGLRSNTSRKTKPLGQISSRARSKKALKSAADVGY